MLERYTSSKPSLAREVTLTARLAGKWQMLMAGRWEVGGEVKRSWQDRIASSLSLCPCAECPCQKGLLQRILRHFDVCCSVMSNNLQSKVEISRAGRRTTYAIISYFLAPGLCR